MEKILESNILDRLADSQKACFDAGLHVAAMDIQAARAEISRLNQAYKRLAAVAMKGGS